MRLVGYVREPVDPDGDSVYAQQEELRRFAADHGWSLVSTCRDGRGAGHPSRRDGYRSLLAVVGSGAVDAVIVPGLDTFAADAIVQEIVLRDLRDRRVRVLSTRDEDLATLDGETDPGPVRMVIRDVLERVAEHDEADGGDDPEDDSVVIHLTTSG